MIHYPTQEQSDIIAAPGNIVVLAGPGSGKTYVVTEKIADILANEQDYQGIIAISFTNKASDELKQRCRAKGVRLKKSFLGTIDRFLISEIIIPFSSQLMGKKKDFEILKSSNAQRDIFSILPKIVDFDERQGNYILQSLRQGKIYLGLTGEFALYILQNVPDAMTYLKARYTHIFIDEYQDCGKMQHAIFSYLVNHGLTGIAVGDLDQAIFSFSNLVPEYLENLAKDPNFQIFHLTQNHRCHESISRYAQTLKGFSSREVSGLQPRRVFKVNVSGGEFAMACQIERHLPEVMKKFGVSNKNEIAILCRSNNTLNCLDNGLSIPHKKFGEDPFERINCPMGTLFRSLLYKCLSGNYSSSDVAEQYFYPDYEYFKYRKLLKLLDKIWLIPSSEWVNNKILFESIASLLQVPEDESAIKKLEEVLASPNLLSFYAPAKPDEINLLTIHKSKGLEFKVVFQMDMYRWVFPREKKNNESEDSYARSYDEALNLHYVAVTRAIEACYLMNGTKRHNAKGELKITVPSVFYSLQGLDQMRQELYWC